VSKWIEVKLKDVCEKVTVGHVGSMADQYHETGIPFLRSLNIKPYRIDFNNLKFIDEQFNQKLKKSVLKANDVAIIRTGYPGTACVIPKSLGIANCSDLVIVRPGNQLNPYFLASIFNSTFGKDLVSGNLVGAAQQHFNITVAKELKLRLPPKNLQDKIAAALSAYDDLIENNDRRITLLEKMAEEIYREWFVHLRFPGHEQTIFHKGIPEDWEMQPFSQVASINPSERFDKNELRPYVGMDNLSLSSMFFTYEEYRIGSAGSKFRNHDTLFPRITPSLENGKKGYVMSLDDGQVAIGSTEFIVMREKILTSEYIYFLTCLPEFRKHAEQSMIGASGRQRVQEECFDCFLVKTPPKDLMNHFSSTVKPLFLKIKASFDANKLLKKTRDRLLTRLISGKLSVEDLDIQFPPSMIESMETSQP
jgi:type I restriction enzyme, S subunit